MEQWKDVKGYEGIYKISNTGKLLSLQRTVKHSSGGVKNIKQKLLNPADRGKGYYCVSLHNNSKHSLQSIHRLVATAFIPNPDNKPQINHINGIRTDNRVENLEWCTCSENIQHAYDVLNKQAPAKGKSKLNLLSPNAKKVVCITTNESFTSASEAARFYGLNHSKISAVCRGDRKRTKKMIFKYA